MAATAETARTAAAAEAARKAPFPKGPALVAICAGVLFGFATGIIGQVLYYWEKYPDGVFADLSSLMKGIMASSILAGAALGALAGGPFADWAGRLKALMVTGAGT